MVAIHSFEEDMDSNIIEHLRGRAIGTDESQKKTLIDNLGEYKYFLSEVSDLKLKLLDKYNRLRFLKARCSRSFPSDEDIKNHLKSLDPKKFEGFLVDKGTFAKNCDDEQNRLVKEFEKHMDAIFREACELYEMHRSRF